MTSTCGLLQATWGPVLLCVESFRRISNLSLGILSIEYERRAIHQDCSCQSYRSYTVILLIDISIVQLGHVRNDFYPSSKTENITHELHPKKSDGKIICKITHCSKIQRTASSMVLQPINNMIKIEKVFCVQKSESSIQQPFTRRHKKHTIMTSYLYCSVSAP